MKTNTITYSDTELRNLVEEYITQQRSEFTLKGVCSYILYWAVEGRKVAAEKGWIESDEMQTSDQERIKKILNAIIADGRIASKGWGEYKKQ